MKWFIFMLSILFSSVVCEAQFSQRIVETDSSYIEITLNGKNKFVEETYNDRDSIRLKTYFFPDTNSLKLEGWKNDEGVRFGEWAEYTRNGQNFYKLNYDKHTCKYNDGLYPFLKRKSQMKIKADSVIMKKFGVSFFKNNVIFDQDGYCYRWQEESYPTGRVYTRKKQGDWLKPIKQEPHGFVLRYTIKLTPQEKYYNILTVELDTLGRPIKDTVEDAIDFEDLSIAIRNPMTINKSRAIYLSKKNPLTTSEYDYETQLKYGFSKDGLHPGEFYYEVTQLYDQKKEVNDLKSAIVKYYNVWRINPYTSELYYKKQQKMIVQAGSGYGVTGKFLELNE